MIQRVGRALPRFFLDFGVRDGTDRGRRFVRAGRSAGSSGTVFEFVCYSLAQEFVHGVPIDLIQC